MLARQIPSIRWLVRGRPSPRLKFAAPQILTQGLGQPLFLRLPLSFRRRYYRHRPVAFFCHHVSDRHISAA
jgi:hypothetical protein